MSEWKKDPLEKFLDDYGATLAIAAVVLPFIYALSGGNRFIGYLCIIITERKTPAFRPEM